MQLTPVAYLGTFAGIAIYKSLPSADTGLSVSLQMTILPSLQISAYGGGDVTDSCAVLAAAAAGGTTAFTVHTVGYSYPLTKWSWNVIGAASVGANDGPVFKVNLPGGVGITVKVSVTVTSVEGCTANGSLSLVTADPKLAGASVAFCHFIHNRRLIGKLLPFQILPDPPPNAILTTEEVAQLKNNTERLLSAINLVGSAR
jgi:hypothetical protein